MQKNPKNYQENYLLNHLSGNRKGGGITFYAYFDSEFFPGFHSVTGGPGKLCVFAFVVEGSYQSRSRKDGKYYTIGKGALSLGGFSSGKNGEIRVTGQTSCRRKCVLLYRTEFLHQILLHYFPEGGGSFLIPAAPDRIENCFDRIKEEFVRSNGTPDEALLTGIFMELLENAARGEGERSEFPETLLRALSYIESNLGKPLTRQIVAENANVTIRTLNRLFAAHLKKGVTEYILAQRLQMAKSFLAFPQYRIGEIAEKCGFGSPIYMTRVFRKYFSCPPREYRKEQEGLPL